MESPSSRAGKEYREAGGARLKTEGQSKVQAWTEEGCPVGMTWRGAEELVVKDVRCKNRRHVHARGQDKELVDGHDDDVWLRVGCLRSEHLGEAGSTM